jgi:tetratricopeptide (TPR) repeat protein
MLNIFILLLALLPIFSRALASGNDISDLVREGIVCYSKGNLDSAAALFNKAIKCNNQDYVAYFERAKLNELRNYLDDAIGDYSRIVAVCPEYFLCFQARYARGVLLQKKVRLDDAVNDYTYIIKGTGSSKGILANSYNNRALVYNRVGDYQSALTDLNRAIEILPVLINAFYNRGATYANLGIYNLALADFNKELQLNPQSLHTARYKLALLAFGSQDYNRCWLQLFSLMQSGEPVSKVLLAELKKQRVKEAEGTKKEPAEAAPVAVLQEPPQQSRQALEEEPTVLISK